MGRRILQRYLNTAAEYNWKYFGSGFYSGSEDSGYWDAFKHARTTFDDPPETDIKSWSDNFESSTWSLFETAFEGYFDGYEETFYSKVLTDRRISTLKANSMARKIQRLWRLRAASCDERNRRVAQLVFKL